MTKQCSFHDSDKQIAFLFGKFQQSLDVGFDVYRLKVLAVASEGFSFWPNQEFLKVPGDI